MGEVDRCTPSPCPALTNRHRSATRHSPTARREAILKLMDEVDRYIPDPVRALDKPFAMPVEDVFSIQVGPCFQ